MFCQVCGHDCGDKKAPCPRCEADEAASELGNEERTMALDASEFDLPDDESEEKTAAIDPVAMGLIDDGPPGASLEEPEEKTAAFDPSSMGLFDDAPDKEEDEEKTAAFDPSAMGLLDEGPPARAGLAANIDEEEKTAAIDPAMLQGLSSPANAPKASSPAPSASTPSEQVVLGGDADLEERTVAMAIPPEFFDDEQAPGALEPEGAAPATPTPIEPTQSEPGSLGAAVSMSPPDTRRQAPPTPNAPTMLGTSSQNSPKPDLKGPGGLPLPAMIGGAVALVLILGGLGAWLMSSDASEDSSQNVELSAFEEETDGTREKSLKMRIPASSTLYVSANMKRLWKSWVFKQLEERLIAELESDRDYLTFQERTGVRLQSLKEIEVGLHGDSDDSVPIALIKMKRLDTKKVTRFFEEEFKGESAEIEGTTFYREGEEGPLAAIIGSKRLALGSEAGLREAAKDRTWKKNKVLKKAFRQLEAEHALRMAFALDERVTDEIPLEEIPGANAIKRGDFIALSIDADDALVAEFVFAPEGDDAEERLETSHKVLQAMLQDIKPMLEGAGDELPPQALKAAKSAFETLKVKKKKGRLYVRVALEKKELEPLIAMAESMLGPPPKKASPRKADEEE